VYQRREGFTARKLHFCIRVIYRFQTFVEITQPPVEHLPLVLLIAVLWLVINLNSVQTHLHLLRFNVQNQRSEWGDHPV